MGRLIAMLLFTWTSWWILPAEAQETRYDLVCVGTKAAAKLTDDKDVVPTSRPAPFRAELKIDLDGGTISTLEDPTPIHVSIEASQPPELYLFKQERYLLGDGEVNAAIEFIEFQPEVLSIHWSSRALGSKTFMTDNTWITEATCKKR
ncbi:hypothetical protein [Sphingomonas sp. CV7422]|uniref:hypothetical protein n=1 Tax=Sphingomonas sp. CV7422 TaxID=3018036 RepID=UPI0022FE2CBC|nr:hypothetical protein [Sphingomonas sp. CV7422]